MDTRSTKRLRRDASFLAEQFPPAGTSEGTSSESDEDVIIDLTSDDPSSPGPSFIRNAGSSSSNELETDDESSDDGVAIVYENIRPTPDLHVEVDKSSNEIIVDFFKKDCGPYYGHYTKKVRMGKKKVKVSISVSIGDKSAVGQMEKGPSLESEENASVSQPASNKGENSNRLFVQCGVCLDQLEEIFASGRNLWSSMCGHLFCNVCVSRCKGLYENCPTCCKKLVDNPFHPIYN